MSRVILYHSSLSEASLSKIAGISRDSSTGPLVKDLLGWGHLSPLEFASLTYFVECPIFVARQIMRHRTGKYMERSLRYTKAEDVFIPEGVGYSVECDVGRVVSDYYQLIATEGFSPEDARAILPMGTMTKFYAQYDLRNFLNLCKYRLTEDAQEETREVVEMMVHEMKDVYPSVYEYIQQGEM